MPYQNFAPSSDLIARARTSIRLGRPAKDHATNQQLNALRLSFTCPLTRLLSVTYDEQDTINVRQGKDFSGEHFCARG
jgi:hypothetical protein